MVFAAIFPGQGSQSVGMMQELYQSSSTIQNMYEQASSLLGYDLWKLTSSDDKNELSSTIYTQPAMLVAGIASWNHYIDNFDIKKIGPSIENNKIFPERCNVTIAQIINRSLIKVKVWERGAGLTKACGTAACATAYAGKLNNLTDNETDIEFEKGKLTISIDEKNSIHMRGLV